MIFRIRRALVPTTSDESVNSSTGGSGADRPLDLGLLVELSAVRVWGTPGDGDAHVVGGWWTYFAGYWEVGAGTRW